MRVDGFHNVLHLRGSGHRQSGLQHVIAVPIAQEIGHCGLLNQLFDDDRTPMA